MPDVDDKWRNRLHYGVIEPEVAQRYGYRPPADLLAPAAVHKVVDAMRRRDAQLPQDASESAERCRQQANDQLTRNATAGFAKPNSLKSSTYDAAQRNPEVVDGFRRWSACMKEHGRLYRSPVEAGDDSRWSARAEGSRPPEGERQTAQDDVMCKEKTNLVAVWFGAEKRLEQKAIEANASYFAKLKAANNQYLRNSREIIRGP
ncbi:hypothetical protein ACIOEX_05690 [Streptomyces sp. NPDC087850]|uniref:hypothetical protein n=1 Tax=Streptomyces sp. NPDC087850 TaxID=3365809 RepID=UPI00380F7551